MTTPHSKNVPATHAFIPPPYKVPLAERLFGIGKVKPPVVDATATKEQLLPTLKLGEATLVMDEKGEWNISSSLIAMYQHQIATLEQKVAQLQDERLNRNLVTLEQANIRLERERIAAADEINQLKFKNKVLMAMCTISEADYKALCNEAGIEPRAQRKPIPSLANPAAAPQPLPQQQMQPQQQHMQQQQQPMMQQPQMPQSNLNTPMHAPPQSMQHQQQQRMPAFSYTQQQPMQQQQQPISAAGTPLHVQGGQQHLNVQRVASVPLVSPGVMPNTSRAQTIAYVR